MTKQAEQIRNLLADKHRFNPDFLTPEKTFFGDHRESLNFDSLEHVEMVMNLEERFNLDIADNDAENLKTVADVIRLVAEMTADA